MPKSSLYPWQGGKFYEQYVIQPLLPPMLWYVEVFGGSFVTLLNKPKCQKEFGNDKFSCLINFWKVVHDSRLARRLIHKIENTLDSRYDYQEYMRLDPELLTPVDRAYRFLYLVNFGFNSYMDTYYTPITHRIEKIKDHIGTFQSAGRRMMDYHERVKNVMFTNYDFRECLQKIKPHKGKFLLLDPPYINTHQYNRGYGDDLLFPKEWYIDMRDLLLKQHEGGSQWMITCNHENTYFDEMPDIITQIVDRRTCINKNEERKSVKSKIIMNYDIKETGSIYDTLTKPKGSSVLI